MEQFDEQQLAELIIMAVDIDAWSSPTTEIKEAFGILAENAATELKNRGFNPVALGINPIHVQQSE